MEEDRGEEERRHDLLSDQKRFLGTIPARTQSRDHHGIS
jgi:hypothetical protein